MASQQLNEQIVTHGVVDCIPAAMGLQDIVELDFVHWHFTFRAVGGIDVPVVNPLVKFFPGEEVPLACCEAIQIIVTTAPAVLPICHTFRASDVGWQGFHTALALALALALSWRSARRDHMCWLLHRSLLLGGCLLGGRLILGGLLGGRFLGCIGGFLGTGRLRLGGNLGALVLVDSLLIGGGGLNTGLGGSR